jgi:hypothetical protein
VDDFELSARLSALDRQYRRSLFVQGAFAAVGGLAIAWLAARTPKTVTAERFVLEDAGGAVRGEWAPSTAIAGEENGKPVEASITCLAMRSMDRSTASLCAPWEEPGVADLRLRHSTGTQASLVADAFNGQVMVTTRVRAEDAFPRSLAVVAASHADSWMILRHDQNASRWTAAGAASSPSAKESPTLQNNE